MQDSPVNDKRIAELLDADLREGHFNPHAARRSSPKTAKRKASPSPPLWDSSISYSHSAKSRTRLAERMNKQ